MTTSVIFLSACGKLSNSTTDTSSSKKLSTSRVSVHDPSIVKGDGKYYIFGSHRANAVSSDLVSWNYFTTNINTDYADIFSIGGKWSSHGNSFYDIKETFGHQMLFIIQMWIADIYQVEPGINNYGTNAIDPCVVYDKSGNL